MPITFERDSVCAGDDVLAPNARIVTFGAKPRLTDILSENGPLIDYLPCVSASRTHWLALLDEERVATISFACEPCPSMAVTLLVADRHVEGGRVYFKATGQERVS